MDIFVDVLLDHSKEVSWLTVSGGLGCSASEAKRCMMDIVGVARERLGPEKIILCTFNGPVTKNDPLQIRLVQTQIDRSSPWPVNDYLTSIYGGEEKVFLQSARVMLKQADPNENLAPDDAFFDIYTHVRRALSQDTLYIPPFADTVLSKLERRPKPHLIAKPSVSATPSPTLVTPSIPSVTCSAAIPPRTNTSAVMQTPNVIPATANLVNSPHTSPPSTKPAKRARKQPKRKSGDKSAAPKVADQPKPPVMPEPLYLAEGKENILFAETDGLDEEMKSSPAQQPPLPQQTSGPVKPTVEMKAQDGGGFVFSKTSPPPPPPPPAPPTVKGGGTLDTFFRKT